MPVEERTGARASYTRKIDGRTSARIKELGAKRRRAVGRSLRHGHWRISCGVSQAAGGRFISHPPPFTFTVWPVFGEHPITDDIQAFDVHDEFYIERCEPSVEIHMVAVNQGVAHPMAWSKQEGAGRVVHIAPGHFPEVWNHPLYQRLMLHAVNWLIEER